MKSFFLFFSIIALSLGNLEAGKISGKVSNLATNENLSGATLQVKVGSTVIQTTTSGSNGNYTFNDIGIGTYNVTASFTGFQSVTNSVVIIGNGTETSNFQLNPLGTISGIITNIRSETAIGSATVQMIQNGTVIGSATTSNNGSYLIPSLPAGSYTLRVSATNYETASNAVTITGGSTLTRNVALTPLPGIVSGTITSSGALLNLAGATITFSLNGNTIATTTSSLLGGYNVSNLSPATYSVTTSLANYQTATHTVVVTSNNTTTLNVSLIPLAGSLTGTVKNAVSGSALSGAAVTVMQGSSTIGTATTNASGTFSISNINPGTYTVTISQANYQSLSGSVTIISNQTTTYSPSLQPLPGNLTGVIINSQTGLALSGVTVKVTNGLIVLGSTTTNSNGSYTINGVAAGNYTLSASLADFVSVSQGITVSAGGTITQNASLTPAVGIVTGVVQDLNSLSLLGGATVELLQGNTVVATTTTSLAGLYSFSVLPGTYTIRVSKNDYITASISATVLSNLTATVNVSLIASRGNVQGAITNAVTSTPLNSASIQVLQGMTVIASTTSDGIGNYSITGLAPGSYTLSVSLANYSSNTSPLIIISNQNTIANVALQPQTGTAAGLVQDSVGLTPLQGVTIGFYQGSNLIASISTNASGNYSLSTLIPGSYTLRASLANYQTSDQSITITSNATTTSSVNLQPIPGTVTGTVTHIDTSASLANATVTLIQNGSVLASTTTNPLGVFSLTKVIPGNYTLSVSLPNFISFSQLVTVNANLTTTQNVSLQPQSGELLGQITNSLTSSPLANVTINAVQGSTIIATTTTDLNGNYSLSLKPGNYTINSILNNYQNNNQPATINSNTTTTLNISQTPLPGGITGTITSQSTNLPLGGVTISAMQGTSTIAIAQTNSLGAYTLSNLAPGNYTIQFSLNNYQTVNQSQTVTSNIITTANVTLQLLPGSITGFITNGMTNTPLNGVTVTALQGATVVGTTISQGNGSYTINSLNSGVYTLTASIANFQTTIQTLVTVVANGNTSVNLMLEPSPGIVSGTITDSVTLSPINGATINAMQNGITKGTASSIANGTYTIANLSPGTYSLVINATNYQGVIQTLNIMSNATSTANAALAPTPGSISGTVSNTNLTPISGALVEALSGNTILASTTTAANGTYNISGLAQAPSGTYTFRASAINHQTSTANAAIVAGATTQVSFTLALSPGTLSGIVTHSQTGATLSGINVQISQGINVISSTTTSSSGSYAITGLAPGSYTVSYSGPNFQSTSRNSSILANQTTTLNVTLQPSPGTLSGIISDQTTSNPLAFATVAIWNQSVLIDSTLTLGDGSFLIGNLSPGNYSVVVSLVNYQTVSVATNIFASQTTTLNLGLQSLPGTISGTVISGSTPLSGASVVISNGNNPIASIATDANGQFHSLGLSPGNYHVTVTASTYQSQALGAIVLANTDTSVNFNLVPFPGNIIGIIRDADTSSPISNAIVTVFSGNIAISSTTTAANGAYTLPNLAQGSYIVTGIAPNYQTQSIGANVLANQTATVNLNLLAEPGSITGRVLDSVTQNGIGGATVIILKDNIQVSSLLTDMEGYYSGTGLAQGAYSVSVQALNYQNSLKGAIILPNATTIADFSLVSSPGNISGQALAGANVNVYFGQVLIATQIADATGAFNVAGLAPNVYSVVVATPLYQTASQSVMVSANASTSITFNLQPNPGNCICTVVDALTSQPLAGINIAILQGNTTIATQVSTSLGKCNFLDLAPGSYVIRVSGRDYQTLTQGLTIHADETTFQTLAVNPEPGVITGVITDIITGKPISGAIVDIVNGTAFANATTDNSGTFVISSLAPKVYTVRVSAEEYQTSLQVTTVVASQTTSLNIGLQAAPGSISFHVEDAITTSAIAGASITIYNPLNNVAVANGVSDALGNSLISGIAPGLYTVVINSVNYQNLTVGANVIANATATLTLSLISNPGSIHCAIKDGSTHAKIAGCFIEALKNTTLIASALTDDNGECFLSGLAQGTYTIRATALDYQIATRTLIILPGVQLSVEMDLISNFGTLSGEILNLSTLDILPLAQVNLFSGQTLIASTSSDILGNFIFTNLAPGSYTLRVSLLNFETFSTAVSIRSNQDTHQTCHMQANPGNILGTVLDSSTLNPIAGAEISVLNGTTSVANVFTDSSGNYSITGLKANVNYTVRSSKDSYQTAIQGVTVQSNQTKTLNFNLTSQPGTIEGKITNTQSLTPISNAIVDILQGSIIVASTQTDNLGNYQVPSLAPSTYTIRISATSYQTKAVSGTVAANQITTINVALQPSPGKLEGTVTDSATSDTLSNVQIEVRDGSILVASTSTDQDGNYLIPNLAQGSYSVTTTTSNYQTLIESISIQSNQTHTLNFALLANPGTILGNVTFITDGSPISSAIVSSYLGSNLISQVVTDTDGSYQISNLAPNVYTVTATASNFQTTFQGIQVKSNQIAVANFSLAPSPGNITGIVTGAVSVIDLLQGTTPITSTVAATDGSFTFNQLAPGNYTLRFQAQNFQTRVIGAVVEANITTYVNVTLMPQAGIIQGIVNDSLDHPLNRVIIDVMQNAQIIESTLTDSSGHYTVTNLAPGNYEVRANLDTYQIAILGGVVKSNTTTTVNFSLVATPGQVFGQVTDAMTGSILPQVEVQALQGSILINSTLTDNNGNYLIENLAPGNYSIRAALTNYDTSFQSANVSPSENINVNFFLTNSPGSVQGQITDASSGLPVTTAVVAVNIIQGNVVVGNTLTDSSGHYLINGMPKGSYTLQISASNYQTVSQGVVISPSSLTTANISILKDPGSIFGTIKDNLTNMPIPGATVDILQGNTIFATVLTNTNGTYLANQLAPGTYTIRAQATNYQIATISAIIYSNQMTLANLKLEPDPGAIEGQIKDNSNNPLVGAVVVTKDEAVVISTVLSDSQGHFIISGLAPGTYIIYGSFINYQTAFASVTIAPNMTSNVNLTLLPQPGSISGSVIDAENLQPLASAVIDLLQNQIVIHSVLTDSSGNFSITSLAPGQYVLRIQAANYQILTQGVNISSNVDTAVSISLKPSPGTVSGTVEDADTSQEIPNATVQLMLGQSLVATTKTDSYGNYIIPNLAQGSYILIVSAESYQVSSQGILVTADTIVTGNVLLNTNPATVTGIVSDTINPIANVRVQVYKNNLIIGSALTDSSGLFSISGLKNGSYTLSLLANAYQSTHSTFTIAPNQTLELSLSMAEAPGILSGTVVDSTTTLPIRGASIIIKAGASIITSQLTDENGIWRSEGLAPGSYTILVSAPSYQTIATGANVQAEFTTAVNTLLIQAPGTVSGQVTSSFNPLAGATVDILLGSTIIESTQTDTTGHYFINTLAQGSYSLRVTSTGYTTAIQGLVIESNQTTTANVSINPNPGILKGVIIESISLQPVAGVEVSLARAAVAVATTKTDVNGEYEIPNLAAGIYTLTTFSPLYQVASLGVRINSNQTEIVNLTLNDQPGSITGQIVSQETGLGLPSANVSVYQGQFIVGNTLTDANGNYTVNGLTPGLYTINVEANHFQTSIQTVFVTAAATSTINSILQPNPGSVTGQITSIGGQPILSGTVVLNVVQGNVVLASTLTDANGMYLINNLPAGTYSLSVMAAGFRNALSNVKIQSGETSTVNFSLSMQPGIVLGIIEDNLGPIAGASLQLFSGITPVASTLSDVEGKYQISNLTPGQYTLQINASNYQNITKTLVIVANQSTTVNAALSLNPGYISGIVTNEASGNVLQNAVVNILKNSLIIGSAVTDINGHFQIDGLEQDSYTISISKSNYQTSIIGINVISGMTSTITVELKSQPGTIRGTVTTANSIPIKNTLVEAIMNGQIIASVTTDSTGAYELTGLAPAFYTVRASANLFQIGIQGAEVLANSVVTANFILENQPGQVKGFIFSDINPIEGASIRVLQGNIQIASTTSRSDGSYSVSNLPVGNYLIQVEGNSYQLDQQGLLISPGVSLNINFDLSPNPGLIQGQVVSAISLNPLSGVFISLFNGSNFLANTQTDIDGNYILNNLPQGTYTIATFAEGYEITTLGAIVVSGEITVANLSLKSEPGTISGTIIDTSNQPISGAEIKVFRNQIAFASAITDSNGNYTIPGLTANSYTVSVNKTDYQVATQGAVVTSHAITNVSFTLNEDTGVVSISVIAKNNDPIVGASIQVAQNQSNLVTYLSNSSGNVLISNLAPGTYDVRISSEGYETIIKTVTVVSNFTNFLNVKLSESFGSLSGAILDSISLMPIENATIEVLQGSNVLGSALTQNDGSFSIEGLAPKNYTLRIFAENYQIATLSTSITADQTTHVTVNLNNDPGSVSGIVTDSSSGLAIANSLIQVIKNSIVIAIQTTDSNGNYSINNLAQGSYIAQVISPNYQTAIISFLIQANQNTIADASLNDLPGVIIGEVSSETESLPNAEVRVYNGTLLIASTQTDHSGNYRIDGLAPGAYLVNVQKLNYQTLVQPVTLTTNAIIELAFDLGLATGEVHGVILDQATALPIYGASISLLQGNTLIKTELTDQNGEYNLTSLLQGTYSLVVNASNYQTSSQNITLTESQSVNLDISLTNNPGTLSGIILDSETSLPIVQALIQISNGLTIVGSDLTDAQGQFSIPNLSVGNYVVTILALNYQSAVQSVNVLAGQTSLITSFLQPSPASLVGNVSSDGQPVEFATVHLIQGNIRITSVLVDRIGNYSIPGIATGSYTVQAVADGFQFETFNVYLTSGSNSILNFHLQPNPGQVEGLISNGIAPLPNVLLQIYNGTSVIATTSSDNLGHYTLSNLAPGNYTILASLNSHQTSAQGVEIIAGETTNANLTLLPLPSSISGTVTSASTSQPLIGATIQSYYNNILIAALLTDINGQYFMNGLPAGSYIVIASILGYQVTPHGIFLHPNTDEIVNFNLLSDVGKLIGVLMDTNRSPISGGTVTIVQNNNIITSTSTGVDGSYIIEDLAPGSYIISTKVDNYQGSSQGITILANETASLDFLMQDSPSVLVSSVFDEVLNPISGAQITLYLNGNYATSGVTTDSGTSTLDNLSSGSYTVVVTASEFQTATAGVILPKDEMITRSFILESDIGSIQGIIRDSSNNPLPHAAISIIQGALVVNTAISDINGEYVISNLKPGSYAVIAALANYQIGIQGAIVIANAVTQIDINLLADTGSIEGLLTDFTLGTPIVGGSISIYSQGVLISTAITDGNGYYIITDLAPNTYNIVIQAPGYQASSEVIEVQLNTLSTVSTPLLSNPGSVEGIVESASIPIANAVITISILQGNQLISSIPTDSNGYFLFSGLKPGSYVLRASAIGYQIQLQGTTVISDQTSEVNFTLVPVFGGLSGTILNSITSNPITNAEVQIFQGAVLIDSAITDVNGNYIFLNLAEGSYTLSILASNYQINVSTVQVLSNQVTTVISNLSANPGIVTGIVTDLSSGQPVRGAIVDVLQGAILITSTLTDVNGIYIINQLAPGSYSLRFTADNYQVFSIGAIIEANATTIENVTLNILPSTVSGTITLFGTSNPLSGVFISILQGNNLIANALTDSNGFYSISGIAPGSYTIQAVLEQYQTNQQGFNVNVLENSEINLELKSNPGRVEGNISDSLNQPISGVTVTIDILQGNILVAQTLTDANGFYSIANLAEGSYLILATANGYETSSQGVIILPSLTSTVNFTLNANPGEISGTIRNSLTSLPLPGVSITIFNGAIGVGSAITDSNGLYKVSGLSPGSYTVNASIAKHQSASLTVNVSANTTTTADLSLNENPGSFLGVVQDSNGGAIPGARVDVSINGISFGTALTSSDGSYLISGLSQDHYIITITASGFQTITIGASIQSGENVTQNIILQSNPGNLIGQIFNQLTSNPLPNAFVQLIQNNIIITSVIANAQGNFLIQNLASGDYILRISSPEYQTVVEPVTIISNLTTEIQSSLPINPGILQGTVTDSSFTTLPNIRIQVFNGLIAIAEMTTDSAGNYAIASLPPGTYTVTASGQGFSLAAETVAILANQITFMNFTMNTIQGGLSGAITEGVTGIPLQGASIDLFSGSTLIAVTLTDVNGVFSFSGISPGNYILRILSPNYQIKIVNVTIIDGENTAINEILTPLPGSLKGQIINAYTGNPIGNVLIIVFGGEFPIASTFSDSFGNYTISNLPPGIYTVQYSLKDFGTILENINIIANTETVFNVLLGPLPERPSLVTQYRIKERFATQTVYINQIEWTPSVSSFIIGYKIYRDGLLVGVVSRKTYSFMDGGIERHGHYIYEVTAVNSLNLESIPMSAVTIPGSCRQEKSLF